MSTTHLLRWTRIEPPPGGVMIAYSTAEDLVRIERANMSSPWRVRCRQERDLAFDDGYMWTDVWVTNGAALGGKAPVEAWNEREIKAMVASQWEEAEAYAQGFMDEIERNDTEPASAPVAGDEAAEEERDRQSAEGLITPPVDPLAAVSASVAAVEPPITEARDARVSEGIQDALDERYKDEVAGIVARLREAADKIERRAVGQSLRDMRLDYSAHAADVLDDLRWMTGNTRTGPLAKAARDADLAVRGRMP